MSADLVSDPTKLRCGSWGLLSSLCFLLLGFILHMVMSCYVLFGKNRGALLSHSQAEIVQNREKHLPLYYFPATRHKIPRCGQVTIKLTQRRENYTFYKNVALVP